MKKTILATAVLCFALNAMAQNHEPEEGLSWQAFLGMNVSKIRGDIYTNNVWTGINSKIGLDIGIRAEYYLPDAHGAYVNATLEWTQKGGKQKLYEPLTPVSEEIVPYDGEAATSYPYIHKINEHYISVPIHIGYRYHISDDWSVFGEVGPYFSVGICGKNKLKKDQDGIELKANEWKDKTFDKNTSNDRSSGGFQRFDCGIGFRVGGEYMSHYSLNLGFDWGLTDMLRGDYRDTFASANSFETDKLKNFCFSLTLGYRF